MESFLLLLGDIENDPEFFLGKKSIVLLAGFIDGYLFDRFDDDEVYEFLSNFRIWINSLYRLNTDHNWNSILLFVFHDEKSAFEAFYDLLEKFKRTMM